MEEIVYLVWLSIAFPYGESKALDIILNQKDLGEFYSMSEKSMNSLNYLSSEDVKCLKSKTIDDAREIVQDCLKNNIKIVTILDDDFPKQLVIIKNVPIVLYYKGNIAFLNEQLIIGIVGTRNSNKYTERVTHTLSSDLSRLGAIIVSGGAVGIDEYAHKGAINSGGRTIVIAGCGLDINYPVDNEKLREQILERNGALISELPPKTRPNAKYFPVRNRIIAGLSQGVCLTHVPIKSGASITARLAVNYGKEIFCVPPWDITNPDCLGVMKFIRDGAKVVADANDIIVEFTTIFSKYSSHNMFKEYLITRSENDFNLKLDKKITKSKEQTKSTQINEVIEMIEPKDFNLDEFKLKWKDFYDELNENQKKIFDSLTNAPQIIDEIFLKSGVPITLCLITLTNFEHEGLVQIHTGQRYSFNIVN